jgi:NAD-dependent SIR2 family protein deacetylase
MLDGDDKNTFHSIRLLRDVADKREKPIIIWAGAGMSAWCGYPTWQATAEALDRIYRRFYRQYDNAGGRTLIQEGRFPELFEVFRQIDQQRYNRELVCLFALREPTPVYGHLLNILKAIDPIQIVTTNVDETLERNLPAATAIQKTDLERSLDLIMTGASFVAKLHGSTSSVGSMVFSTTDYRKLTEDASHLETLQNLFVRAVVVFVGYSLRDKYVLDLFEKNCGARRLFGDGPHFLVLSSDFPRLPDSIRTIRYLNEPHADHRSAMIVLDIIRVVRDIKDGGHSWFAPDNESRPADKKLVSAYYISDIIPTGTWTSSQSLILERADLKPNVIIGQGFDDSELPEKTSPAMYDLAVGLISFDYLYFPLSCTGRLHDLLGSAIFWELVKVGIFRFIHFEREPIMMFRSADHVSGGSTGLMHISAPEGKPFTIEAQIRSQFKAAPGRESEVEGLFEVIQASTTAFDHTRFNVPSLTRGVLLHPSVQRLLGISDAVIPTNLPRWVTFPVLRLAHTIMVGCACESSTIPATKIGFGSEVLVGAAFAASAARDWADSVSSYVLAGRFNADLGAFIQSDPSVLIAILKFRDTQPGVDLRREILKELATNAGSEFIASVNGGLRKIVPTTLIDKARDELSGLLFRESHDNAVVPAVWMNIRNSDSITRLWRARSRREFHAYCRSRGIRERDLCPCDSGEQVRLCCAQALRN